MLNFWWSLIKDIKYWKKRTFQQVYHFVEGPEDCNNDVPLNHYWRQIIALRVWYQDKIADGKIASKAMNCGQKIINRPLVLLSQIYTSRKLLSAPRLCNVWWVASSLVEIFLSFLKSWVFGSMDQKKYEKTFLTKCSCPLLSGCIFSILPIFDRQSGIRLIYNEF